MINFSNFHNKTNEEYSRTSNYTILNYNHFYLLALEELLVESKIDNLAVQKIFEPYKKGISKIAAVIKTNKFSKRNKDDICKCYAKGKQLYSLEKAKLSYKVYGNSTFTYVDKMNSIFTHFISNEWNYHDAKQKQGINFLESYFREVDIKRCIDKDAPTITGSTSKTYEPQSFRYTYIYEAGIRHATRQLAWRIQHIWRSMHNYQIDVDTIFGDVLLHLDQYSNKVTDLQQLVCKVNRYGSISYEEIFGTINSLFTYCKQLKNMWQQIITEVEKSIYDSPKLESSVVKSLILNLSEGDVLLAELEAGIHLCSFRLCGGTMIKGSMSYLGGIRIRNLLEYNC